MLATALCFAVFAACSDVEVPLPAEPPAGETTYAEGEVRPGLWRVHSRVGPRVGSVGGSLGNMFHMAEVTERAGKTYYRTEYLGEITVGPIREPLGVWDLHMWDEPPDGAVVMRFDDFASFEASDRADKEDVVQHAPSLLAFWRGDRDAQERSFASRKAVLATRTVEVDALGLERRRFAASAIVGEVRSLAFREAVAGWPTSLFVADRERVSWLDRGGALVRRVKLANRRTHVVPYEPVPGEVGFLDIGGGWQSIGALDAEGRLLWEWKDLEGAAPNELAAGDLDGDGRAEFVVGTNGLGGVFFLDADGAIEHIGAGSGVFSVAILDVDSDGELDVLYKGTFKNAALDKHGVPKALSGALREGSGTFFVVRDRDGTELIAQLNDHVLTLTSPGSDEVERYDLPGSPLVGDLHAARVRWTPNGAPHLAVSCAGRLRDHLFVLDPAGAVVHHELIGGAGLPLAVLPGPDGTESLLVGTADGIWRYAPGLSSDAEAADPIDGGDDGR